MLAKIARQKKTFASNNLLPLNKTRIICDIKENSLKRKSSIMVNMITITTHKSHFDARKLRNIF